MLKQLNHLQNPADIFSLQVCQEERDVLLGRLVLHHRTSLDLVIRRLVAQGAVVADISEVMGVGSATTVPGSCELSTMSNGERRGCEGRGCGTQVTVPGAPKGVPA